MILSAELFNQILEALKSDENVGQELRAAPRVGLRAHVDVILNPGSGKPPVRMRCRDLSASGIGLLHNKPVSVGEELVARLPAAGTGEPVHLSCVVVHCKSMSADLFRVGARIIRVMSPEEAIALAARGKGK